MVKPREDNSGNIFLEGDDFDLKIDVNRKVYAKKKGDTSFTYIEKDIPTGYNRDQKTSYLHILYEKIRERQLREYENREYLESQ